MWSIPVILFGIFIAADAKGLMSLFTKKRDVLDLDNYHCWVGRHECFRTLQQYEDTFGDLEHLNELLEASFLDQLCQDLSSLKACNADLLAEPGCDIPYIREQTDREDAVADYICKDKTKRLIMAMKDSPCLTDVSTLLQMEGEVSDCDRHLYQNPRLYEDPGQEVCIIKRAIDLYQRLQDVGHFSHFIGNVHRCCCYVADAKDLMSLLTKKRYADDFQCYYGRHVCSGTLDHYENILNDVERLDEIVEEDFLDQLCKDFTSKKTCNEDSLAECGIASYQEQADLEGAVADSICTDQTKRLIMAMKDSPCSTDVLTILQLARQVPECYLNLFEDPRFQGDRSQEVCIDKDVVNPCLASKGMMLCGHSVMFGSRSWEVLQSHILQSTGCSSGHSVRPLTGLLGGA